MAKLPQTERTLTFQTHQEESGQRLDIYLSSKLEISRSHLQRIICKDLTTVNGSLEKKGYRLEVDDVISVTLKAPPLIDLDPKPIDFEILHEEEEFLVVNKPAGLSVHPVPGQRIPTLVHGLLYKFPQLSDASGSHRPGIVHRLDRFTSGVIIVAKTNRVHINFSEQFFKREVLKEYCAIVEGLVEFDQNEISEPIARHQVQRKRMTVSPEGKPASTRIDVLQRFSRHSYVRCLPKTGRRHQIRVHCQHMGNSILGDTQYGGSLVSITQLGADPSSLERFALHAQKITLQHPLDNHSISFEAPLPQDIKQTLDFLNL